MKKVIFLLGFQVWLLIGPVRAQFKNLYSFADTNGYEGYGDVTITGGKLYGMTSSGGGVFMGNIFSMDTSGNNYKEVLYFDHGNGESPFGSLTLIGNTLYGMTSSGGRGYGNIFSIDSDGRRYRNLFYFDDTNGALPLGNLLLSGGKFYGTTANGGKYDSGCIFSIDTNGNNYMHFFDFGGSNGSSPCGTLIQIGNKLFGMTTYGGAHYDGCIFSINMNGSGYNDLYDFNSASGKNPFLGRLTAYNGKLYGMTKYGGTSNYGVVFSIDTNGSGYKTLLNFNYTNGALPGGSLTLAGNALYGMTSRGGANGNGTIFSIDTSGSMYNDLCDFDVFGNLGMYPYGSLTLQGNSLFGMTSVGGLGQGNVFKYTLGCMVLSTASANDYCPAEQGWARVFVTGIAPPYTYLWSPGGQTTDSISSLSAGVYSVTVTDSTGCSKTASVTISKDSVQIKVTASPDTIYVIGDSSILSVSCPVPATYLWAPSGATTQSIIATPTSPATYTVFVTTACGTYSATVTVYNFNCINNYSEPICIATMDTSTGKYEIIWGRTNSPPQSGFGYYKIYRDSGTGFKLIAKQPLNRLSDFLDFNSPNYNSPYSYELSTFDSCGESALSSPVTTMFLTVISDTTTNTLSWTPYIGFTPTVYRIFRGSTLSTITQIDSVPNTVLTYVDSFPPVNSYYAIEAVDPAGACIPTLKIKGHNTLATVSGSFSNEFITSVLGVNKLSNSQIDVKVFPNPTNGKFRIMFSQPELVSGAQTIIVSNMVDETVYCQRIEHSSPFIVDLSGQPSGIYTLRVQTNSGIAIKKIVLMKN